MIKKVKGRRPQEPNAAYNRSFAVACLNAGASVEDIVKHWPKIWKGERGEDGVVRLAQIYDTEYADGYKDTRYSMLGVDKFIANYTK